VERREDLGAGKPPDLPHLWEPLSYPPGERRARRTLRRSRIMRPSGTVDTRYALGARAGLRRRPPLNRPRLPPVWLLTVARRVGDSTYFRTRPPSLFPTRALRLAGETPKESRERGLYITLIAVFQSSRVHGRVSREADRSTTTLSIWTERARRGT
jgi:hypothetical protein